MNVKKNTYMLDVADDYQEWLESWLEERPEVIRRMVKKCPPDRLYRLRNGDRCTIISYSEDETVTVEISGEFSLITFPREVFGVDIDTLVEDEGPKDGETVGVTMSGDETLSYINKTRLANSLPPIDGNGDSV